MSQRPHLGESGKIFGIPLFSHFPPILGNQLWGDDGANDQSRYGGLLRGQAYHIGKTSTSRNLD